MTEPTVNPLGAALSLLFIAFPSGVTDATKTLYYGELERLGIAPETVAEAAQKILHSREQRTVPPLAVILKACQEVQQTSQQDTTEKRYTLAEARDLAERRLRLINQTPNLIRKIPVTDANIDLHVAQMEREGVVRVERGAA